MAFIPPSVADIRAKNKVDVEVRNPADVVPETYSIDIPNNNWERIAGTTAYDTVVEDVFGSATVDQEGNLVPVKTVTPVNVDTNNQYSTDHQETSRPQHKGGFVTRDVLNAKLAAINHEIDVLTRTINTLSQGVTALEETITELDRRVTALEEEDSE